MLYEQIIDDCLEARIGSDGLSVSALKSRLFALEPEIERLRIAYKKATLTVLRIPDMKDDLVPLQQASDMLLDGAADIVMLGTGGSSLGAQALAQLKGYFMPGIPDEGRGARCHFFDNLDAHGMSRMLARFDLTTTRFVVISKSGGTAETLAQTLVVLAAYEAAGLLGDLRRYFVILTEPADNPLRRIAEEMGCLILDHPPIGGRYSVLTNVGLFPAILMGLDVAAVRAGAMMVLQPLIDGTAPANYPPALGAALSVALAAEKNLRCTVMMPYGDGLERFAMWYRQLWAESLGKDGKGTTPIRALGPVDQHSQLQLYLAGAKDKMFTLLRPPQAGFGPRMKLAPGAGESLDYLEGRYVGDLVDAEARATAATLAHNGRPVRQFILNPLSEEVMGALFMHFMLETILAAALLKVDAFDQPAVEEGKVLAQRYLSEMEP